MKLVFALLIILIATPAYAAHHHPRHHYHHHHHRAPLDANGNLVTVQTAVGIPITVAPDFAPKITAFISALAARGYRPRQIHCAASHGHVRHSLHYSGHACDFDQRGWGKTARSMYHIGALARATGLRDGCEFRDCGHIDSGEHLTRFAHHHHGRKRHYARLNKVVYNRPIHGFQILFA